MNNKKKIVFTPEQIERFVVRWTLHGICGTAIALMAWRVGWSKAAIFAIIIGILLEIAGAFKQR